MKKKSLHLLLSLAIMTGLMTVAFSFDDQGIHWMWQDQQPVAWMLGGASIVLCFAWIMKRRLKT